MIKFTYVVILIVMFKLSSSQNYLGDKKSVFNFIQAQQLAWNKGDIEGFMSFYWNDDSLMFIGKKGVTYGWKNTKDNYIKSYPTQDAMGKLTFEIIKMEQFNKSTIYVIGKWELDKEKPVGGCFTLVWKKMNGKWFIISDHTS
jgi:ketosteroid isomerase-like protein